MAVDSFPELVQAHALASHFVFAAELERGGLIHLVGEKKIGRAGRWVGVWRESHARWARLPRVSDSWSSSTQEPLSTCDSRPYLKSCGASALRDEDR